MQKKHRNLDAPGALGFKLISLWKMSTYGMGGGQRNKHKR